MIFIFWLNAVADRGKHTDDALNCSGSLGDMYKPQEEILCLRRNLWKQEGEF
jgi:hypothetical protein